MTEQIQELNRTIKQDAPLRTPSSERGLKRQVLKIGRALTSPIRTLPDFIIIGAPKCGTTSLYYYLIQHPNIVPAFWKEIGYFSRHYTKGSLWYRAHFPIANYKKITGEATVEYLYDIHAPKRMFDLLPNCKLIAMLRNPADRAYSHYMAYSNFRQNVTKGQKSIQSFEDAFNANSTMGVDTDPNYCEKGKYLKFLKAFMQYFPILVIQSEDFYKNTQDVYNRVLRYLGQKPYNLESFPIHLKTNSPPIDPETRKKLMEYYRPYNEELYASLKTDFRWE